MDKRNQYRSLEKRRAFRFRPLTWVRQHLRWYLATDNHYCRWFNHRWFRRLIGGRWVYVRLKVRYKGKPLELWVLKDQCLSRECTVLLVEHQK